MLIAYSANQVRAAEEPLLSAGVDLMSQAAFALATQARLVLRERGSVPGGRVVILVGAGNNGGDGLFAGAFLAGRGVDVTAILVAEQPHPAGLAALRQAGGRCLWLVGPDRVWLGDAVAAAFCADVVLDALLGIGATGPMRSPAADLVTPLAELLEVDPGPDRPVVIAVDTPSGIGVDDGTLPGAVLPADVTVTFGTVKPGLLLPPAASLAGRLVPVDIGLDFGDETPVIHRLEPADVAMLWPIPGAADHKYTRGVVGIVAGTTQFPGAAVLTTSAAIRSGAGMVRFLGPDSVAAQVLARRPEAVRAAGQVQAWVLGPGVAEDDLEQMSRIGSILRNLTVPAVVDAGAFAVLPELLDELTPTQRELMVLTPHAGELARLLTNLGQPCTRDEVEAAALDFLRRAVERLGMTVLLKGATTLVASPTGVVFAQADGTPWLATAGSGDVLAGVLGSLIAQLTQVPVLLAEAAAAGVLVHGQAARRVSDDGPIAALDIAEELPNVLRELVAD